MPSNMQRGNTLPVRKAPMMQAAAAAQSQFGVDGQAKKVYQNGNMKFSNNAAGKQSIDLAVL